MPEANTMTVEEKWGGGEMSGKKGNAQHGRRQDEEMMPNN